MDTGLLLAIISLSVAGIASVLGIWMERDPNRPPRWAVSLTILIGAATVVSLFQSAADAKESAKAEEDLARMLQTLDKIAGETGQEIPELNNFISKEMETQSRANPDVIQKMANRVAAEGGDPNTLLAKHLPASEMKGLSGVKAQPGAGAAGNSQETTKLKGEIATLKQKLAQAETSGKQGEEAKKAAEAAKKEKADADAKIQELQQNIERLEKQNERLKGRTTGGGSRWDKG